MAEKLKTFDFTQPSQLTSTEKATYPWDDWFDDGIWQITEGEDFHTHPLMMERIIRTRATGRGARVQMRHLPKNGDAPFGIIVFQRTDEKSPAALKKAEAKAKREARKAEAEKAAAETLAKAGIKATKSPAKSVAKKAATKKAPSKTPAKRPVKQVA